MRCLEESTNKYLGGQGVELDQANPKKQEQTLETSDPIAEEEHGNGG